MTRTTLAFLLVFVACDSGLVRQVKRYQGQGTIRQLARNYQPGVKSEGYELELPPIATGASSDTTFALTGLPLVRRVANLELITFTPQVRGSVEELDARAPDIPADHHIRATLFDTKSGRVFAETKAKVASLGPTATMRLMPTKFIRHVLQVDLSQIPSTEHLALRIAYDVGQHPGAEPIILVIVVDAPTL